MSKDIHEYMRAAGMGRKGIESFDRIMLRAVDRVLSGASPEDAMRLAVDEDNRFLLEMSDGGKTERAKLAREALSSSTWASARGKEHDAQCARRSATCAPGRSGSWIPASTDGTWTAQAITASSPGSDKGQQRSRK